MAKQFIGLDIGGSNLKITVSDGARVLKQVSEPVPDGLVREGRILSMEAMSPLISDALKKHNIRGRDCAVSLPSILCFTRRLTMPMMTPEQLDYNLPYEFRDFITEEKDKYFYDYAVLAIQGEGDACELDLIAGATLKQTVADYAAMLRRAGLRLKIISNEEFAYMNLIRAYESRVQPERAEYCIIDCGHSTTRVLIYTSHRFEVTRNIELGGMAVDNAIADALNIDQHMAHAYKATNYNDCLNLESCHNIYQSIALEVNRAINFYGYNNRESDLDTIYYSGEIVFNDALRQTLKETTGLNVLPLQALMNVEEDVDNASSYGVAFGVTIQ